MRRAAVMIVALATLAGCAQLGYQSAYLRVPRTQALLLYADARELYGAARTHVALGCRAKTIPEESCEQAEALRARVVMLDAKVRLLMAHGGEEVITPELAETFFRLAVSLAAIAGGLP